MISTHSSSSHFTLLTKIQETMLYDTPLGVQLALTSIPRTEITSYVAFSTLCGEGHHHLKLLWSTRYPSENKGKTLPLEEIRNFILENVGAKSEATQTYEVCWLLFWARELRLAIPAEALGPVTQLRSSVLALLTLDLRDRGLLTGAINEEFWSQFASGDGLRSEMWLAAYEVSRKGWWTKARSNSFIKHHPHFGIFDEMDISFYDPKKQARAGIGSDFLRMLLTRSASHSDYEGESDGPDENEREDEFSVYD